MGTIHLSVPRAELIVEGFVVFSQVPQKDLNFRDNLLFAGFLWFIHRLWELRHPDSWCGLSATEMSADVFVSTDASRSPFVAVPNVRPATALHASRCPYFPAKLLHV